MKTFKINVAYSIANRNFLQSFTVTSVSYVDACAKVFWENDILRAMTTHINSIR